MKSNDTEACGYANQIVSL